MRCLRHFTPAAVLAFGLAACATSSLDLAPPAPDVPWTPATKADGEIIAGEPAKAGAPRSDGYVLPPNPTAAGTAATGAAAGGAAAAAGPPIDTSHPYTLAELIDLRRVA